MNVNQINNEIQSITAEMDRMMDAAIARGQNPYQGQYAEEWRALESRLIALQGERERAQSQPKATKTREALITTRGGKYYGVRFRPLRGAHPGDAAMLAAYHAGLPWDDITEAEVRPVPGHVRFIN